MTRSYLATHILWQAWRMRKGRVSDLAKECRTGTSVIMHVLRAEGVEIHRELETPTIWGASQRVWGRIKAVEDREVQRALLWMMMRGEWTTMAAATAVGVPVFQAKRATVWMRMWGAGRVVMGSKWKSHFEVNGECPVEVPEVSRNRRTPKYHDVKTDDVQGEPYHA